MKESKTYPRLIAYAPADDMYIIEDNISIEKLAVKVSQYYGKPLDWVHDEFLFAEVSKDIPVSFICRIVED